MAAWEALRTRHSFPLHRNRECCGGRNGTNDSSVQFNVQKFPDTSLGAGYLFIAPRGTSVEAPGAYIFSGDGELIWDGSEFGQAMSFTPKMYKGQPVIAMWQGEFNANGYGMGHGLLINQSYQVVANM